jgi:hypothetical protein
MTTIIKLVAAAAVSVAASLPALAEETKAAPDAQPIPTLHCEFKSVNACAPDGTCKAGKDLAGMPLPLKVTAISRTRWSRRLTIPATPAPTISTRWPIPADNS